MICAYLGPLSCGFAKGIIYAGNDVKGIPDWTQHLLLLGGLTSSVFALAVMLRIVGRIRTSATITVLLILLSIVQMFTTMSIGHSTRKYKNGVKMFITGSGNIVKMV